jgi:hypothetical protein
LDINKKERNESTKLVSQAKQSIPQPKNLEKEHNKTNSKSSKGKQSKHPTAKKLRKKHNKTNSKRGVAVPRIGLKLK